MPRIRKIEIRNYRSIRSLDWYPTPGINCLIGPGDSGKSTILDAIDLCLGARRNLAINDTDFFNLDVTKDISISVTLGDLPDALKNIETYGLYLRTFEPLSGLIEDEPHHEFETVLTLNLQISSDLEPVWTLVSKRAEELEQSKSIVWKDRLTISPARLGNHSLMNLSWTRGSVLNKLSDERPEIGNALITAAREARNSFGEQATAHLANAIKTVNTTAKNLGVPIGEEARALLDTHSVSFSEGAISLHNGTGVPLRNLGTGSSRLLIAGLHREASTATSMVLVDEVEYGLEPHRIIRLLDSLGAKNSKVPLQVFMTSHSPVVIRELGGNQLMITRNANGAHSIQQAGDNDDVQSTIRSEPEAFFARTIVFCEGASEVGFLRGLDLYFQSIGEPSLRASAVAYSDTGGGTSDRCVKRGLAVRTLGYRAIAFLDNDKPHTETVNQEFTRHGGKICTWRTGNALEDELFLTLPRAAITELLNKAEIFGNPVNEHIVTKSGGKWNLEKIRAEFVEKDYSYEVRQILGDASSMKKSGWFKSITEMEIVANEIIGPNLAQTEESFQNTVKQLFRWAHGED